ncbi:MAG TPA: recombination protein RecR, partial [bacterium]|nr:recombination protein RecR [bacterium]
MEYGSDALSRLVDEFARLPGIGRKTARRLAFHVLKTDPESVTRFAEALQDVKRRVQFCAT